MHEHQIVISRKHQINQNKLLSQEIKNIEKASTFSKCRYHIGNITRGCNLLLFASGLCSDGSSLEISLEVLLKGLPVSFWELGDKTSDLKRSIPPLPE